MPVLRAAIQSSRAGLDLPQQITFEFRERRHHRTDQLALRRGQIKAISGPWRGESAHLARKSIRESGLAIAVTASRSVVNLPAENLVDFFGVNRLAAF